MAQLTESEALFEGFCVQHRLDWQRIPTGPGKSPDFELPLGSATVHVEIEQIESRRGFNPGGVHTRTVGSHVRQKISEARGQAQSAAKTLLPVILLIHNAVDPLQTFGTETHDFLCGMYGELTVRICDGQLGRSFHGRNARLRRGVNTSFGGVGHLKRVASGAEVGVFENVYAAHPLPFASMPTCMKVMRIQVEG